MFVMFNMKIVFKLINIYITIIAVNPCAGTVNAGNVYLADPYNCTRAYHCYNGQLDNMYYCEL